MRFYRCDRCDAEIPSVISRHRCHVSVQHSEAFGLQPPVRRDLCLACEQTLAAWLDEERAP
jgi:hypothetical protein